MTQWPKLAGMHEAAKILGVSKARIDQLQKTDLNFPQRVTTLRATPVWVAEELAAYDLTRNKRRGPAPKAKES